MRSTAKFRHLKVALAHDFFLYEGGAERVFYEIVRAFKEAGVEGKIPVYTLYSDKNFTFPKDVARSIEVLQISTGLIRWMFDVVYKKKIPFLSSILKVVLVRLMPVLWGGYRIGDVDVIVADTSSFGFHIVPPVGTPLIAYVHTPFRALWGLDSTMIKARSLSSKILERVLFHKLRELNSAAAYRVHAMVVNSTEVKGRVKRFFNRDSKIIFPPVDIKSASKWRKVKRKDYFVFINRLEPYKKICELVKIWPGNRKLIVVGKGSLFEKCKRLGRLKNVEFLGFVPETKKWRLLAGAKALVYPNLEDFGISMAEALAVGTPVIALRKGGALDIVEHEETGYLLKRLVPSELRKALAWADNFKAKRSVLYKKARRFSAENFRDKIRKIVIDEYNRFEKFSRTY